MWHQAALCALPFSPLSLFLSFSLSLFLFLSLLLHRCPILAILRLAVPIASSCHFRDNVLSSSFIIYLLSLLSLLFFFLFLSFSLLQWRCSGRVGFSGGLPFFRALFFQLRFTRQNNCWLREGWDRLGEVFSLISYIIYII